MGGADTYTGVIKVSSRGMGYFHVEDTKFSEDIEIQGAQLKTALNGDTVEIKVLPEIANIRRQGEVKKIITRAKMQFVGTLETNNGEFFFLKPDDKYMYRDLFIHGSKSLGAQKGDKVLAEIVSWKDPTKSPEGKVLRVLGRKGVHNVEMEAIILEKGFESGFPEEVELEAKKVRDFELIHQDEELKNRKDFRQTTTFTIDPADAKDFDDALSFKDLGNSTYEIGIHIADVSHFVKEGSILDTEARKRGTSVYLVDRTIPMLPEILSNDLCSLNPDEDKLTFSSVFVMDDKAKVLERWFGKTVIHSDKRFTYEDAQASLDSKSGEFFKELDAMNRLAKIMQKEKFKNGAIEFETDEVKFELDKDGKPIRVYKKVRQDTNKMIEEFMLLANREVALYMHADKKELPTKGAFIYRIHDLPDKEKIMNLNIFLKALGYNLDAEDGEVTAQELNTLLKEVEGRPEESLVKTAAIRSMQKAVYSTRNIGHFGLGFPYYTHFTSPIRRYPDVLVHRLLFRFLTKGKVERDEMAKLEKLSIDATEKEIAASEAERASIKYKQVEFMLTRIGEICTATISGVSEYGMYVEEEETKADGMVRFRNMTDDTYTLDQKNYAVVGTNTKKKYSLGDTVKIKLLGADLDRKQLDFVLEENK